MLALRYVYVLALVVWLGGMLILGAIVAPTTFEVLQASAGEHGRELAGAVFGSMLARFHYVAYGAGALLLLTLTAMRVLGPRPARGGVRAAIIAVMLGVALYSASWSSARSMRSRPMRVGCPLACRLMMRGAFVSTRCTSSRRG